MPSPQRYIVEELKNIDRDLSVQWVDRAKRFMVFHKDRKNKIYPVMKVQYKDGSYKPVDKRTVDAIKYSNHLRHKSPQDILYMIDKENEELELNKKKKLNSDIENITKDNWRGMMGVPMVNVGGIE